MDKLNEGLKITGHIKATVIRANGEEFVHHDEKNTIQTGLLNYLAAALQANTTASMDNLFNGNTALDASELGEDGIWIEHTDATRYEMNCSWSGSGAARKLTGTFSGTAITIAAAADVMMGQNLGTNGSFTFSNNWAAPSSWASLSLAAADTLTIEWTITIS